MPGRILRHSHERADPVSQYHCIKGGLARRGLFFLNRYNSVLPKMVMKKRLPLLAALLLFATFACTAVVGRAADTAADPATVVLAENRFAKLTLADYEAEIAHLPAELRYDFATSPRRVATLLDGLLMRKTLAAQARALKLEPTGDAAKAAPTEDGVLAQLYLQRIEHDAGAAFDAKSEQMTVRARELYVVEPKRFARPEQVSISHILFSTERRGDEPARKAAEEAKARLDAGADFAQLAAELSDDAASKTDGGKLGFVERTQGNAAILKAAFALPKQGAISEPVHSLDGYHIIRLDDRRAARQLTFDEALPGLLAEMRAKYVTDVRDARLSELRNDPTTKANQTEIDRLVNRPRPVPPAK